MFSYTHVSREGSVVGGKQVWKGFFTDGVEIPTTLDDVRALLSDPAFTKMVKVTLNEQAESVGRKELKQVVEMPLICKLLANSIGLKVNAEAKAAGGVQPLKVLSEVLTSGTDEQKAEAQAALAKGKDALKDWATKFSTQAE